MSGATKNALGDIHTHSRVNKVDDLRSFMQGWDDPSHSKNSAAVDLRVTQYGNINETGIPGNYRSGILSRWHPQFYSSLEAGIKELVLVIIECFDWITYSSCEGHCYGGLSVDPTERQIGLLPRNEKESNAISLCLSTIADAVNDECAGSAVNLAVFWETLESDLGVLPVIRVRFSKCPSASWESYFQHLAVPYKMLIAKIRESNALQRNLSPLKPQ